MFMGFTSVKCLILRYIVVLLSFKDARQFDNTTMKIARTRVVFFVLLHCRPTCDIVTAVLCHRIEHDNAILFTHRVVALLHCGRDDDDDDDADDDKNDDDYYDDNNSSTRVMLFNILTNWTSIDIYIYIYTVFSD